jgi:signal peptidase II
MQPTLDPRSVSSPEASSLVPRSRGIVLYAALATLALTGLDLGTKTWAESTLSDPREGDLPALCEEAPNGVIARQRLRRVPLVIIEDWLDLEYAENCGAAFGILRGVSAPVRIAIFGLAALGAVSALFWMLAKGRGGRYFAFAVPFVASGALGNLADRMRYGYVVDFIHAHYRDVFDYPTFNVADIAITIGVVCWIIDAVREGREVPVAPNPTPRKSEPTA